MKGIFSSPRSSSSSSRRNSKSPASATADTILTMDCNTFDQCESVEVNADSSILPLHVQDALRNSNDNTGVDGDHYHHYDTATTMHKSSSKNSLSNYLPSNERNGGVHYGGQTSPASALSAVVNSNGGIGGNTTTMMSSGASISENSSIEVPASNEPTDTNIDEELLDSSDPIPEEQEEGQATTMNTADLGGGDGFEQLEADAAAFLNASTKRQQQETRKKLSYLISGICILMILVAAILIGVLVGTQKQDKDGGGGLFDPDLDPDLGGDVNEVVIDIENPNDFPPTLAPAMPNNGDDDDPQQQQPSPTYMDDSSYFPPTTTTTTTDDSSPTTTGGTGTGTGNNVVVVDPTTNYCPIMEGAILQNFTNPIRMVGRIDERTQTIGSNNNPNATALQHTNPLVVELPSCQDNTAYGRGKWFIVKGPGAVVRASTCQSMGLVWDNPTAATTELPLDTQLSVFTSQTSNCVDGLECVTGNDDSSCGLQSIVSWYAEQDRLYYIFLSGKPTNIQTPNENVRVVNYAVGNFGLTLELAPIGTCDAAIDYKSKATAVSRVIMDPGQQTQVPKVSSLIVDTLLGGKFDMDPCLPGQWLGRGGEIWYRVTGTGRFIMASTCSSTLANEFPPRLALYVGNCDQLQCGLAKASEYAPSVDRDCGFGYSLNWWASLGVEYYIMVYKTNFLPGIQFGLTVEDLNPPTNDNCTGAERLFADGETTYGSTLRATYTPEHIAPTCTTYDDVVTHSHPGVWYRVLGTGTRLTASLCDDVTEFDTKISVYEGSCANLRCVTANDEWCGYQSSVYWESTAGTMYFILVHGSTGGTSASMGDFGLTVFEFKPSINDYCSDAILVQPGSVTEGTTSTASSDEYVDSCDFTGATHHNQAPGVWYKVIGTGAGMRASTCGSETTYDTRISVYRGADCQQLQCVVSDDNGCGFQSSAYWFSNVGETYYILVSGNLFSSFGDFVLRIEDYQPNTINDFCANALTASTTTVNLGSTRSATFDGVETCVVSNTAPGIWYKVEGSGTGMVASTCHIVTDFDTRISVFRGSDCEALECVAGNDDSHQSSDCGSSAGSRVSWLSTLGEDYHILVHGWGALVGTFGLTIEEVVPLVANDFCITSAPVIVSIASNDGSSQELLTQGTTVDATVDNVPICGDVETIGHGVWYKGVGTGNRLMASTCNGFMNGRDESIFTTLSTTMPGVVTDFDTQISVFRGGCRTLQCLGANNDRCGLQSSVNFFIEKGEPFYVLVHGHADSKGSFGLVINEIFPQVPNDFCDMATPFAIAHGGGTNRLDGSTSEASYDTVEECIVKNTAPGVWYRTTGTGQTVTVTTCGGQTDFDTRLSVYTGSCQALECVTGNDDTSRNTTGCGLASTASWPSIEGQTYFVRVHGWGSTTGNFQLSIYETPQAS